MYSIKLDSREDSKLRIIWLHGWGTTHQTMIPLAESFKNQTENYALDLPGFGKSEIPDKVYSSEDYADIIADFIKKLPPKKTIIVGHSAGGRIAICLADNYSNIVNGIVLVGGAGIPVRHSIFFKIYAKLVKTFSPILKKIFPFLKKMSLSSSDYRNSSGIMREIFIKMLKEDLREEARGINIPTLLIYGDRDTATPVYMGEEYHKNIKNSILKISKGANHYDLLLGCKKQTNHYINTFIREQL